MVFCCIAIVAIAIIYFCVLWLRQVFSKPRRDWSASPLKAPPRALSGNRALPVYGHTLLFQRLAGDAALLFPPTWREMNGVCWPKRFSEELGECFAMYIWGQWRVVVKGPERTRQVLESQEVKEAFPWTPPITLLGKSCFSFLNNDDANQLRALIQKPLNQKSVIQYASLFAEAAETCLDDVMAGVFLKKGELPKKQKNHDGGEDDSMADDYATDHEGDEHIDPYGNGLLKLKWEALRSYTFDIVDGPLFGINKWNNRKEQSQGQSTKEAISSSHQFSASEQGRDQSEAKGAKKGEVPSRDVMLLWMERMKRGVDVIKLTFGPEWMYIWLMNEYGRALNARMYLQDVFTSHIGSVNELVPVSHKRGHTYRDPTTQPFPLLTLRTNYMRDKEGIFGDFGDAQNRPLPNRARCQSAPDAMFHNLTSLSDSDDDQESTPQNSHGPHRVFSIIRSRESSSNTTTSRGNADTSFGGHHHHHIYQPSSFHSSGLISSASSFYYVEPFHTEQDLARPRYEESPYFKQRKLLMADLDDLFTHESPSKRKFMEDIGILATEGGNTKKASQLHTPSPVARCTLDRRSTEPPYDFKKELSLELKKAGNPKPDFEQKLSSNSGSGLRAVDEDVAGTNHSAPTPDISQHSKDKSTISPVLITPQKVRKAPSSVPNSLLDRLMRQEDISGHGISQAVMCELSLLLWMMLDVGNAWTTMAFNLLASDSDALGCVQEELDQLAREFGRDELFSKACLSRMKYVDALLYEAIRLCPPFLGGLWTTTKTIEFKDIGVQLPKDSHIFFCQPTIGNFSIHNALGRKPEELGKAYPTVELYGFLPLQGLEVPLMVLQSKVFLITALQRFSPYVSKRSTFIRRVQSAVSKRFSQSFSNAKKSSFATDELTTTHDHNRLDTPLGGEISSERLPPRTASIVNARAHSSDSDLESATMPRTPPPSSGRVIASQHQSIHRQSSGTTPTDAMRLFTKIPFPEPHRVIHFRPRELERL